MSNRALLGVAGSLRAGSWNRRLLEASAHCLPSGWEIHVFEGLAAIPMFDEDLEARGTPLQVQAFAEAVTAAPGLILSTPEYNHGLPGVLKNALDWLSRAPGRPLVGKPVCVMGATTGLWGTRLAQAMLRQVLFACQARVMQMPSLCLPEAAKAFDQEGALIDKAVEQGLKQQLGRFGAWIEQTGA